MTREWNFSRYCLFCITILLFVAGNSAWAETVSREAQKYMNRGMAAAEMAKSPAEYEEAAREFEKAARLAPDWPAPYFNLGYVQNEAGKYREALNNYRKYLKLAPNAPDAEQVQTEIDQIEYRLEKALEAAKIRSWLEGEWVGWGSSTFYRWPVRFIVNGDSVKMYAPMTSNLEEGQKKSDYKTISVKQKGRKIQFSVVLKTTTNYPYPSSVAYVADAQFNLTLISPDKMEGTVDLSRKKPRTGEILVNQERKTVFMKK